MNTSPSPESYHPLVDQPVPELIPEQLAAYTPESIHASKIGSFDAGANLERIKELGGSFVIGADFGGDKGNTRLFKVVNGQLELDNTYSDTVQGDNGEGYLESLERTAAYARENNYPIGLSWGGPLDGTQPQLHAKFSEFLQHLNERYDGDIANISPDITACINDGPAGAISGAIEGFRRYGATDILFVINGGGIGLSAVTKSEIYSTEAGHVKAVPQLNKYNQADVCGVFGADYTCLEQLGANKVGIERQWQVRVGSYMRARDIEDQYKAGDTFAGELYENSAKIVAHVALGSAQAFDIELQRPTSLLVGHGGAFKFPHYGERIAQILSNHLGQDVKLLMTKDYGPIESNACLDGAAIAALCA